MNLTPFAPDRLDWQKRAAAIGAWRELCGYHHPADPIGPEPVAAAPTLIDLHRDAAAASPACQRSEQQSRTVSID